MASQNVLNLADTMMVGTLGHHALAAVGNASFLNLIAISLGMGLAVGVQTLVSRRLGQGYPLEAAMPLFTGLRLALLVGLCLSLPLSFFAPEIYQALYPDPNIQSDGSEYLRLRLLGVTATTLSLSFRGFFTGIRHSSIYLKSIVLVHLSNIILNYLLIFGHLGFPALGAAGAGLASTISVHLGLLYYLIVASRKMKAFGFAIHLLFSQRQISKQQTVSTGTLLRLSAPTAIQQLLFGTGLSVLFWIVSLLGTAASAAAYALINLMLVAILPSLAFGIATTTLVSHALGASQPEEAKRWPWRVAIYTSTLALLSSSVLFFGADQLLELFLADAQIRALAIWPMRIFAIGLILDNIGPVFQHALLGAGASRQVMLLGVTMQWLFFLPIAFLLGPFAGYGLSAIWAAQSCQRLLQAAAYLLLWRSIARKNSIAKTKGQLSHKD